MRFAVVEVGSTNTKAYLYNTKEVKDLGYKTIEFKNNYKKMNEIDENDKKILFEFIDSINEKNIYVFGTSIFRTLTQKQKENWLKEFKEKTNHEFHIVTSDMENELTVYGVISNINYKGRLAIMIAGGGSTELSIIENKKVIEEVNSTFGAMDTVDMFPDIKEDYAKSAYEEMINKTKLLVNKPQNRADILILTGGDFLDFYEKLNYPLEENKFYKSNLQPYYIDVKKHDEKDYEFFYKISLDKICKRSSKPTWWRGTRGMRLCVKAFIDTLKAKYIIPTSITMVYGIVEKIKNNEL